MNLNNWIRENWALLKQNKKLEVPRWFSQNEVDLLFTETELALNIGQDKDFICEMSDGSRLHIHLFKDGKRIVHRDAISPRGPISGLLHCMVDTNIGKALSIACLFFVIIKES